MARPFDLARRRFVSGAAFSGCSILLPPWAGRLFGQEHRRAVPLGVQSGDVTYDSAVVWAACDRTAQLSVSYALSESMRDARRVLGPVASPETGGTSKVQLLRLPPGQEIFYEVRFLDPRSGRALGDAVPGRLRTAPRDRRDVSFAWSGDTVGQGWGINPDFGGLKIYEAMRRVQPDFFIHSGDLIYADGPLVREVQLPAGGLWRNIVTEEKSRVAETLDEFRGNYRYNLMDEHLRRFNAEVPQYVQWDDHEVHNNWQPGYMLEDARYQERSCDVLAERARQAFLEFTPIAPDPPAEVRIHRSFRRGPLLEVFLLDLRSFRGLNSEGRSRVLTPEARILGAAQLGWLKAHLRASRALWKVVASDMPLGLLIHHDSRHRGAGFDGIAQGDGPALGRELEIAELLSSLRRNNVRNVVFLTADVHYCATHRYAPDNARFVDFKPFYEFISGPLHAGALGPNRLDSTFGPEVVFSRCPPVQDPAPTAGYLHFGHVRIDGRTGAMTVTHRGLAGEPLHEIELPPET